MIKGIDIGNFSTKDETGKIFESKISSVPSILGSKYNIEFQDEFFVVGEGNYDTTYRKVEKYNYIKLLFSMLSISKADRDIQLMLGLPLSQYKTDRENLKNLIRSNFVLEGKFNGLTKRFVIQDVEVYPEGIASLPIGYEGVLIDIGGLTTDCCMVTNVDNRVKIEKPISIAKGTLNLYNDFINLINSKYGLNLSLKDSERIIKNGLKIKGEKQNIKFAVNIFKEYLEDLIRKLNLNYSLDTNNITFVGGGSLVLKNPILKRLPYAEIDLNPIFANAKGFYREGCRLWKNH